MTNEIDIYIPNCTEFWNGCDIYNEKERKGPIYFEARSIISDNWGNPEGMARGVSVLIRGWNHFYANFDIDSLTRCIEGNLIALEDFSKRHINTLSDADDEAVRNIFNEFVDALRRVKDNKASPVSAAKALNPLAPDFFPIWDSNIAFAYDCFYLADIADSPYINFCKKTKIMAERVVECVPQQDDRSLLKRIDEFNYSKYTMHWI